MSNINKKFYSNFLFYSLSIVIVGGINFISIPLIIENYGVTSYGEFSLVQNVVLILVSFGGGWLNQNILRFNNNSYSFKVIIFQYFYIVFIPLFFISLFIFVFLKYNVVIATLGAFTIFLGGVTALMYSFFQSRMNAKSNIVLDLSRVVTFVIILFLFPIFKINDYHLLYIVFAFFISYFVAFLVKIKFFLRIIIILFKDYFKSIKNIKLKLLKNKYLIDYGWPLSLWFTVSSLLNVADRYIIDFFLSNETVGRYSAIYDLLYKAITIVCAPILAAGYPVIAKHYNSDEPKKAYSFIRNLILLEIVGLCIIVIVAYYLRGFFIINVARLSLTQENIELVIPILIGAMLWQISMLLHKPLELRKETKKMLIFIIIAFAFNLITNFIFIPIYGVIFAAYSTILSSMIYLLLNLFYVLITNKYRLLKI